MSSIEIDLEIRLLLTQWEKFVKHLLFLQSEYGSSEINVTDQFIDIRRVSPVPRPIISRIYYRIQDSGVVIHRALIFSPIGSDVYGNSEELKKEIHFLMSDFFEVNSD